MQSSVMSAIGPQTSDTSLVQTAQSMARPMTVPRDIRPIWVERGWHRSGNVYAGFYRTRFGAHAGKIVRRFSGHFSFWITSPPVCLFSGSHGACFIHESGNTYKIHFRNRGLTIDDGILAIERVLLQAYQGTR